MLFLRSRPATAIDPGGWQRHEWHDVAGPSYADTG